MSPPRGSAAAWRVFLAERAPLGGFFVIGGAQALSAFYLFRSGFDPAGIAAAALGIAGILLLLRLMDEVKDFDKDRIAHPGRPLPRGLLPVGAVRRSVRDLAGALVAGAALVALRIDVTAGIVLAGTVVWALLMYRDFFLPRLIARDAFVYAATHQVIVLPMYAFAVAAAAPGRVWTEPALWFALTGLGASFAFELCRKLDPDAHPVLGTYLGRYGPGVTAGAVVAALGLLAFASWRIDVHMIVWPFIGLVLLALPLLYLRPARFRLIAGAATLLAFAQMLAPALRHLWRAFA
jgi:hypothetical protein